MAAVTGIIVIVLVALLAVVGGNSAAKTVSVAQAVELEGSDKIQVTGNVAENSFTIEGNVLTFDIYDAESDPTARQLLGVRYDGGVSATFGNDVVAICTGKKDADGVLNCSELVTKCPSKYESGTDALTVQQLVDYGDKVWSKPVKVAGAVKEGSLAAVNFDQRFVLLDEESGFELPISYAGAIPDGVTGETALVLTGSIAPDGVFVATDVALEG
jgi:cytochrome c-type biogenesis protein CcmE